MSSLFSIFPLFYYLTLIGTLKQLGFTDALSRAKKLRTLIDDSNGHSHGAHTILRHDDIKHLMSEVPNLRTIVCENRIWRVRHICSFSTIKFSRSILMS